jgi:hypothetical protein
MNDVPPTLMEATSADSVDAFKPMTTCFRFKSIPCAFEWIKRVPAKRHKRGKSINITL